MKEVYRNNFSSNDLNRPEWAKLIKRIKKKKNRSLENIRFIK